jgi:hypothetical protein
MLQSYRQTRPAGRAIRSGRACFDQRLFFVDQRWSNIPPPRSNSGKSRFCTPVRLHHQPKQTLFFLLNSTLMKRFIHLACTAALLLTTTAATQAQEEALVYNRRLNRSIGITPMANAVGTSYSVVDAQGTAVLTGKINTSNTFFLPTSRLKKGAYRFMIGSTNAQSFIIK